MRYKKRGPCKDFDMETDMPRKDAECHPDNMGVACDYWMESSYSELEDGQGPCRRKELVEDDTLTMEMF